MRELSRNAAARLLEVSPRSIQRFRDEGQLHRLPSGNYDRVEVEALAARRREEAAKQPERALNTLDTLDTLRVALEAEKQRAERAEQKANDLCDVVVRVQRESSKHEARNVLAELGEALLGSALSVAELGFLVTATNVANPKAAELLRSALEVREAAEQSKRSVH